MSMPDLPDDQTPDNLLQGPSLAEMDPDLDAFLIDSWDQDADEAEWAEMATDDETTEQQTTSNGDLRNIFDRDLDAIDPELDRWLTEYWEAREQPPSAGDNQGEADEAE
jgi:hypothetical protein